MIQDKRNGEKLAGAEANRPAEPVEAERGRGQISRNALLVLERRYLRKDADGNVIETPDEMFQRVARAIAKPERMYGSEVDARTDLYALGKIIYRMLTGEQPRTLRPVEHSRKDLRHPSAQFTFDFKGDK